MCSSDLIEYEEEEIYKENILDHFRHPRNFGELKQCSFSHCELNPVCGDMIQMFVLLDGVRIKDVRFKGSGCAISIACASMLTDYLKGKSIWEIKRMDKEVVLNMLGINLGVVRIKCGLLALKTVLGGLRKMEVSFKNE